MISQSKDGEFIAKSVERLGIHSIRGSSSRGGGRALAEMMRILKQGGIVALTPDGPRGPVFEVQTGVVQLAQKMECPVIPLAMATKRKKIFSSWDRFEIPYPFNRISVVYGDPMFFSKEENLEACCLRLKMSLDEVTREGDRHVQK